jgi:hypothetical protein
MAGIMQLGLYIQMAGYPPCVWTKSGKTATNWVKNGPLSLSTGDRGHDKRYCTDPSPAGYVGLVAAFVIIGLITDFFGTFLTGLGLRSTDPNKKYKYYRVAIYALVAARKCIVNMNAVIFVIVKSPKGFILTFY